MIAQPGIYHCGHCNKDFIGLQGDVLGSLKCPCPQCGNMCSTKKRKGIKGIIDRFRSYLSIDGY